MAPKHSGERSCSEISIQAKGPSVTGRDKETERKKYDKVDADVNCVNSTDSVNSSPGMAKSATPGEFHERYNNKERNRISTKTVDVLTSLRKHYRECAPFEIGPVESDANHRNETATGLLCSSQNKVLYTSLVESILRFSNDFDVRSNDTTLPEIGDIEMCQQRF
ncbi:hypothetical protein EVAR_90758_1 [Eumeta japonica]|uniref:Uncharacterized protein n=1 Tax=Eumeta variegata TaxID=151549 RepID=A0A4C1SPD1_EUMVA|nr:hypothetical protein EVAR_90758_1 [Eumeta japonica]